MQTENTAPQLDLAAARIVPLRERDRTYTLTCRRILPDDWKAYYAAICVRSSNTDDGRESEIDVQTPLLTLVDRVLVDAGGYKVAGGAELKSLPEWKQRIPIRHRLQLGRVLSGARPAAECGDDLTIHPEGDEIYIDAPWTAAADGGLLTFTGLRHVLATPSEKQFKRYAAEASRSTVVGGSRNGATIFRGASAILAALYDELVIAVDESYVCNGAPLAAREEIVREMDYSHKVQAAQELLQPQQGVDVPTAKEDAE